MLRKCCPLGQDYVNASCRNVDRNFEVELRNQYHLKKFSLVFERRCRNGTSSFQCMASDPSMQCRIEEKSGSLVLTSGLSTESVTVPPHDYCLDFINKDETGISSLVCLEPFEPEKYSQNISYGEFFFWFLRKHYVKRKQFKL